METLDKKSPLFIDDIIKSISLINLVKDIYKHKTFTELDLKLYRKDDSQFNGRILREKVLDPPFSNHPFIQKRNEGPLLNIRAGQQVGEGIKYIRCLP